MDIGSFPFLCRKTHLGHRTNRSVPWHWHNVFEINYVTEGALTLHAPGRTFTVGEGQADFIRAGVLHACEAAGDRHCEYYTLQFDMHFLSGMVNSIFEEKYFLPVMHSDVLQLWPLPPDSDLHRAMIDDILKIVEVSRIEPFGYEFDIRSLLGDFWKMLFTDTRGAHTNASPKKNADAERIKLMMHFINEHCAEKLTLDDIAASAGISTRECTRCFSRCINLSPNVYLTQRRILKAIDLLTGSAMSVTEISEECGFSSPSYFTKVFRDHMDCTPKEYRMYDGSGKTPWYHSTQFSRIRRRDDWSAS